MTPTESTATPPEDRLGPPERWPASAGPSLAPATWPGGCACAAALSFDLDFETPWERTDLEPSVLSSAEYGTRRGIPRVLALLATYALPATFFVPGLAARRYEPMIRDIAERGHEIALHGWAHERPRGSDPATERRLLHHSIDTLEEVTGTRPVGLRVPSFDVSEATIELAEEAGLRYDSSLMADDEPYQLLVHGRPSALIELPVDWLKDDATFFVTERWDRLRPIPDAQAALRSWLAEYEGARCEGGLFQLTLHPDLIGHRSRITVLEQLLERMRGDGDTWAATHADVVQHCRQESQYA